VPLDELVLGHLGPHRLQVKDLAALHPGDRLPGPHQPHMHGNTQRTDAAAASARLLPHGDSTFPRRCPLRDP
jgi:hypothetical protein